MITSKQTVGSIIATLMPEGSQNPLPWPLEGKSAQKRCEFCPNFPTDVFAVAAYLCQKGGVISFFDPSPYAAPKEDCHFILTVEDREAADSAAELWRDTDRDDLGQPPKFVEALWKTLIDSWGDPLTPGPIMTENYVPYWWRAALLLVMIADMACNRLLRDPLRDYKPSPFETWMADRYLEDDDVLADTMGEGADDTTDTDEELVESGEKGRRPPASLCQVVDSGIVCVLPKVRVAPVGATLRNLSRNLALLPGRGEVRCSWHMSPAQPPNEDTETLDVLLIPEPSQISAKDFVAVGDKDPKNGGDIALKDLHYYKRDWESFELHQNWIGSIEKRREFRKICVDLLASAQRQSKSVNGVVLPEYALTFDLFEKLCADLKEQEPNLEFVISGSSDNCETRGDGKSQQGNHVVTRVWYTKRAHQTTSRRKHHRWRMNRSQVETYALSAALNPKIKNWWESTPLGRREVHFHRFRKRSVFSVLICEELARSDPCHEILRSVAPNLIFALLLDGPQIKERWPAQYAANLADDPGSSVLTFTSFGLIDRSNKQGHFAENRAIALWKDDTGNFVQIDMPKGDGPKGVLLSLWSEHVSDRTITGKNSQVRSWRYSSHFPIYSKDA